MAGVQFLPGLILLATLLCIHIQTTQAIFNSQPADLAEFKYQICLRNTARGACLCSGALINPYYVLTVANCLPSEGPAASLFALAGALNLAEPHELQQQREILNIAIHNQNTIALLELSEPFKYNDNIQPISFEGDVGTPPTDAIVSGWGATLPTDVTSPDVLQQGPVTILEGPTCLPHWTGFNGTTHLCAWGAGDSPVMDRIVIGGKSDHGNPLRCTEAGRSFLCGLAVSGTYNQNTPDLYIKTSFFLSWINQTVKQDQKCEILGQGYHASAFSGKYFHCVLVNDKWLRYVFSCPRGQDFHNDTQKCTPRQ